MKSDSNEAIKLIERAISFKGNFSPYIKLYIQLLFFTNNNTKALKVLKKYWAQSPDSLLRSTISDVLKENKIN